MKRTTFWGTQFTIIVVCLQFFQRCPEHLKLNEIYKQQCFELFSSIVWLLTIVHCNSKSSKCFEEMQEQVDWTKMFCCRSLNQWIYFCCKCTTVACNHMSVHDWHVFSVSLTLTWSDKKDWLFVTCTQPDLIQHSGCVQTKMTCNVFMSVTVQLTHVIDVAT